MTKVYIVAANRTPMGAFQGELSALTAPQLGSEAIKGALAQVTGAAELVEEVYMGNVLPGGLGQAPARQAALGADLDVSIPCNTISKVCGSGMKATMIGADRIRVGDVGTVLVGGMESMTNAPYILPKARGGYRMGHGEVLDHMFYDGLQDAYTGGLMGSFAEKTAADYDFKREAIDDFAVASLERAQAAWANGKMAQEVTPLIIKGRKGDVTIETDEQPRRGDPEKIRSLRPAFAKDGVITAANASSISDGGAALMLMSEEMVEKTGATPIAQLVAHAGNARIPAEFTIAPAGSIEKVLAKAGWQKGDVDAYEINEAFAIVTMASMVDLGLSHDAVNVYGGACALGHPIGCSGARLIVTLLNVLKNEGGKRGIASLCIGGGEATAVAVELV